MKCKNCGLEFAPYKNREYCYGCQKDNMIDRLLITLRQMGEHPFWVIFAFIGGFFCGIVFFW